MAESAFHTLCHLFYLFYSTENTIFTISNQGEQITAEAVKYIFDKFYQVDKAYNTQGNDLGLAIVKRIVAMHNGSVNVCSADTAETIFKITLLNTN